MQHRFDLARIEQRLQTVYGDSAEALITRVEQLLAQYAPVFADRSPRELDQSSAVLITYADQVTQPGEPAIRALDQTLARLDLDKVLSHIHFLPFFPYSSDDGFSVINYRKLNDGLGKWTDVQNLAQRYGLMFDLVLNHVSAHSDYFQAYLKGKAPYDRFFIEVDPATDVSQVTRPRALPLLTPFQTSKGERHIWTTFSADQVDLNYAEPDVLLEMIDVLLFFVAQGATLVRLDAIAYLWKTLGTNCIHLPQTHEIVKLLRDVLEQVAPHVRLITETNVPHNENVSYFGEGDEAHLVYQFSLPPLLLEATLSEDASAISSWLSQLQPPPPGCMFFNFAASHDGVGVRPLEGLVSQERFDGLVEGVRSRGGLVSMKRDPSGAESPYELNVSYFSAVAPDQPNMDMHVRRFLSTQAIVMSLQGVPGLYFHSLFGTPNDVAAAEASGISRRINRRKFGGDELNALLADADLPHQRVLDGMKHLLSVRASQSAFHPQASQEPIDASNSQLLMFRRRNTETGEAVTVVANFGSVPHEFSIDQPQRDLLSGQAFEGTIATVDPYQVMWLA